MPEAAAPATITKTCPKCGVVFTYGRSRGHGLRRYCSATCRKAATIEQMKIERAALYVRHPFACRNCGAVIDALPTSGRPKSVYCSSACKEAYRAARQTAGREATYGERACKVCGKPLALGLKGDAVTCSRFCGTRYQNRLRSERARLARSQRPRPPCPVCGAAIAPERRRNTIYCSPACKMIALGARYRAQNPDAQLVRYQMQPGDYDALLRAQGGRCAICGAAEAGGKGGRFHVDHDHATSEIRGLLCHGCNLGIGLLRDDPDIMRAAIRYVERKA